MYRPLFLADKDRTHRADKTRIRHDTLEVSDPGRGNMLVPVQGTNQHDAGPNAPGSMSVRAVSFIREVTVP